MTDQIEKLTGGRGVDIVRQHDTVLRPAGPWTPGIHAFLKYLHRHGFQLAPRPLGFDDKGNERLSFLPGNVHNYPLNATLRSDELLISAAQLLKAFHQAGKGFCARADQFNWQLPVREPIEVMCHGDFAPYNLVEKNATLTGIIDFDTLHPGPAIWDLAYAIYRWAPLKHPDNPDSFGDIRQQLQRAKLFCDTYEASIEQRQQLAEACANRLQALVDFMQQQAKSGDTCFQQHLEEGHHLAYLQDKTWISEHAQALTTTLLS